MTEQLTYDEQDIEDLDDVLGAVPLPDEDTEDQLTPAFVADLINKVLDFNEILVGHPLHSYQIPLARRVIESVLINDGEEVTALAARQSGKTETVSDVVASLVILLPRLALIYPDLLGRYKDGFWVGMFAPVEGQVETMFARTVSRLTSDRAVDLMGDPEIDDKAKRVGGAVKTIRLTKSGSFISMMTANPRAKIESRTFHLVVIDECQEADDYVVAKSIAPMLAYHAGTMVKTGTPSTHKGNFYRSVMLNQRRASAKKGAKVNHFQWDHRDVAKINPNYGRFIKKEILRIGEDSDEFQMSYCGTPQMRLLTADLRHVPAGDVVVGQELLGFDEERPGKGLHRNYKKSVVEAVGRIMRPCYRIELEDSPAITVSSEHRWLVFTAGSRTEWKATKDLVATDRIFRLTDTWETDRSYEAGYLAAALDGEGHLARRPDGKLTGVSFAQKDNPMLEQVRKFLADKGYLSWDSALRADGVHKVGLAGGQANVLRFLGEVRPVRLLGKFDPDALGSIGRHDHTTVPFQHPRVTRITDVGEQEVVAIRTTTRTYIAEGLASHNCCRWILERGMFTSQTTMDRLGDTSMKIQKNWTKTPVVVGIDPARKTDSTVVTVVWVDWDRPDEFGYYDHRVLNWLELQGDDWEVQYARIVEFLSSYNVLSVAVDANGVGDAVAQRLRSLLPRAEVHSITSSQSEQSKRFKHLLALMERDAIGWPAHAETRRLRLWRKFQQQMLDAERVYKGQWFTVKAPDEAWAHDDFVDSLSLATMLTSELQMSEVEVSSNPFFTR